MPEFEGDGYAAWINQPDIAITPATASEKIAISALKNDTYKRSLGAVTAQQVIDAKTFVTQCAITTNVDGSVRGSGLPTISNVGTLSMLSLHVQSLARAYGNHQDNDALSKLQIFLRYLEEQGLAEGAEGKLSINGYPTVREFAVGFLESLPYIEDADSKSAVIKMLKWLYEYNVIYNPNPALEQSLDYMHNYSRFLVELALLSTSDDEIARDLKSFSRYLEKFSQTRTGAISGIKPDGVGFHHNSQHISYLYAYSTWIYRAVELKGTPFKISQIAYD
ncbi:MAG: hypothetical protein EOO88_57225, partial [Pedobacter sp.]